MIHLPTLIYSRTHTILTNQTAICLIGLLLCWILQQRCESQIIPNHDYEIHVDDSFMRPNTPHVVFTAEDSVCVGGHFYTTSTLRHTCFAILHTAVAGTLVTNTGYMKEAFIMLARLMAFYMGEYMGTSDLADLGAHVFDYDFLKHDVSVADHVPDLSRFEGFVDLFTLFCILELANTMNHWGQDDKADRLERRRIIYARARARHLRLWIFSRYELVDQSGASVDGDTAFFFPYLVQQARALLMYNRNARSQGVGPRESSDESEEEGEESQKGEPVAMSTINQFHSLIVDALYTPPALRKLFEEDESYTPSFAYAGPVFSVRKLETPSPKG
jgi:hypothetical protein